MICKSLSSEPSWRDAGLLMTWIFSFITVQCPSHYLHTQVSACISANVSLDYRTRATAVKSIFWRWLHDWPQLMTFDDNILTRASFNFSQTEDRMWQWLRWVVRLGTHITSNACVVYVYRSVMGTHITHYFVNINTSEIVHLRTDCLHTREIRDRG